MPYPKVSADQVDQQIHAFEQTPAAQSVEQQQQTQAGISPVNRGAPAKPVDGPAKPPEQAASAGAFPDAPKPDLQTMAKDVAAAQTTLNQNAPGPQIPWESALKLGGTTAAAVAAAHYLFGGEKDAGAGDGGKSGRTSVKDMPKEPELNKVHNSLQDLMAAKDEGLLASQRAEQAAGQLAQETPQAVSSQVKPLTDVAIDEEIGKPLPKEDIKLVAQGTANKELNAANADVVAAEKAQTPTGSVPPKAKEQKTFKKIEELPKDMHFKAGVGGGDSWLHDTVGPDVRKFIIDEFNAGKPIGGGEEGMKKAYGMVSKYEQWLKENIPEQTLTRAERKFAGIPPAKQHGPLGKAAKVAGAAGLLMTAAQAANAREAAGNVAEALMPWGLTPSALANGELTPEILAAQDRQMKEMQKLGSPHRSVPPKK